MRTSRRSDSGPTRRNLNSCHRTAPGSLAEHSHTAGYSPPLSCLGINPITLPEGTIVGTAAEVNTTDYEELLDEGPKVLFEQGLPKDLDLKNNNLNPEELSKLKNLIKEYSDCFAPIVIVDKKDGSPRFCVDYRKLNGITKKDVYPLPRIDDCLSALGGHKYFSTFDLAAGYWQIPIAEEDAEKTAFISHQGLFEFNVMPFGLCNAPATFQRCMDKCLAGLKWRSLLVYLDDIIVFSQDVKTHLEDLKDVFERLR